MAMNRILFQQMLLMLKFKFLKSYGTEIRASVRNDMLASRRSVSALQRDLKPFEQIAAQKARFSRNRTKIVSCFPPCIYAINHHSN